jgi:hypothetical protein
MRVLRSILVLSLLLASACATHTGASKSPVGGEPPATASASAALPSGREPEKASGLIFDVRPSTAEIFVGAQSFGRIDALPEGDRFLSLPPGLYRVSLKSPGHRTWRAEVLLGEQPQQLSLTLAPLP